MMVQNKRIYDQYFDRNTNQGLDKSGVQRLQSLITCNLMKMQSNEIKNASEFVKVQPEEVYENFIEI